MTTANQATPIGYYLINEEGPRSRDQLRVTVAGAVALPSGTVLARVTAGGAVVKRNSGASDGSETAIGVLLTPLPGVNGIYPAVVHARRCEVNGARLNEDAGLDAPGVTQLRALGVLVR